jgi:NitT/TauT family transport system ATP-binding protein
MTYSTQFIELVQRLKGLIREESLAAMGSELKDGGLGGFSMEVGPLGMENVV